MNKRIFTDEEIAEAEKLEKEAKKIIEEIEKIQEILIEQSIKMIRQV
ncbi:MAG: hypothetical protein ACFFCM_20870 [Promethearchaeota archaeon]